jgi:heterodisulfide reductase subunit A-like polyferredoxin
VHADLVVLATGMAASLDQGAPVGVHADKDHFLLPDESAPGIFPAGCARGPVDVATAAQDGTAAALKAIGAVRSHGGGTAGVARMAK